MNIVLLTDPHRPAPPTMLKVEQKMTPALRPHLSMMKLPSRTPMNAPA